MFRIVPAAVISLLMFSCGSKSTKLPYYNTPDFTPQFINDTAEVAKKITHRVANFSLTDQNGLQVTQRNVDGKIHVANFFFSSCGTICPKLMENMKKVAAAFKGDTNVVLLSFSVTPWIDSVPRLKSYAAQHGISSSNWHLLTGDKAELYQLARRSYFAEDNLGFTRNSSDFLHSEHVLLVDRQRRIRAVYNGTLDLEIRQLIKEIKLLESSE